jgi:hypothetical protein
VEVVTEGGDAAGVVSPRRGGRAAGPDGARVLLGLSSGDVSTRSSGVNEPQINVDHFYHRPTFRVVGLLSEQSEIQALSRDLASAGVDVSAVEILCGEQGARILDAHGRYHRLRARIVRAFQQLGTSVRTALEHALAHWQPTFHAANGTSLKRVKSRNWSGYAGDHSKGASTAWSPASGPSPRASAGRRTRSRSSETDAVPARPPPRLPRQHRARPHTLL